MPLIRIGYGQFSGYLLTEIADDALRELESRFPLDSSKYDTSEGETLLITVAVHEERARRNTGGLPAKHIPSVKEFAQNVIATGFRHLSKIHHPDRNGEEEAQRRLTVARQRLVKLCCEIDEESEHDGIVISPPYTAPARRVVPSFEEGITDDDVPF